MTLKTKAALLTEIAADAPDNTTGAITPGLLRTMLGDIVGSYTDWTGSGYLSFVATGVDFNSGNADNAIAITLPTGRTRYQVQGCVISNASHTLVTATCGLFTATGAGGVAIVTSASAITVSATADATNNNSQSLTINNSGTESYTASSLQFRVQTAEGAAATGDVTLTIKPLP